MPRRFKFAATVCNRRSRQARTCCRACRSVGWTPDEFLDGLCDAASRGSCDSTSIFSRLKEPFKKPLVWNTYKNPELEKLVKDRIFPRQFFSRRPSASIRTPPNENGPFDAQT